MITIIAQNRTAATAIARATGNDETASRYFYGNKYYITWLVGKAVEITTPRGQASYWFRNQSFPHVPKYFTLSVTNRPLPDGISLTQEAATQLTTIRELLNKSESIIVATEPTQEGELNFRYLYAYLGCKLPYRRAIINDLMFRTINYAIQNTVSPETFDKWHRVARLRDEADWLIGVNARRAIAFAAGRGTYRIGRTSASVLKMIGDRRQEIKDAVQTSSTYATIAVKDSKGNVFCLRSVEPVNGDITPGTVKVLSVTTEQKKVRSPKLYNLVNLQMDAARLYGMTPLRTYEAAIRLYERKLISYPVAASNTVTKRRYEECRRVLTKMLGYKNFASVAFAQQDIAPGHCVGKSAYGTQGIVATPVPPLVIDNDMERVYSLIVKRMYQAFCKDAVTLNSSIEAECDGIRYHWNGVAYKSKGWHSLFPDTVLRTEVVPSFTIGEELTPVGHGTATFKSPEVKPYTDATLIQTLMEIRGATHSEGIAKDIVHLEASGLIERDAWGQISLTERGLSLYFIIKSMKIADIAKVKEIDDMMGQLLRDKIPAASYDRDLKQFTRDITAEILSCAKFFPCREDDIECPHCSEGVMKTFGRVAMCDNPDCGHYIFRQYYGVTLTHEELTSLIKTGSTPTISGFRARSGKSFSAKVILNANGQPQVTSKNKVSTV